MLQRKPELLEFRWHISRNMLQEFYLKHFSNNGVYHCMSHILAHKYSNTKWALHFYPMGDGTHKGDSNDKANIFLTLQMFASRPNHFVYIFQNLHCLI